MGNFEGYIGLLIQVPLVGVFIWFALKLVSTFLESLEHRDLQWQSFLKEQREANNMAIGRLAEELKTINTNIGRLEVILLGHDQITREAVTSMRSRVER
jgi:hypothetical protein